MKYCQKAQNNDAITTCFSAFILEHPVHIIPDLTCSRYGFCTLLTQNTQNNHPSIQTCNYYSHYAKLWAPPAYNSAPPAYNCAPPLYNRAPSAYKRTPPEYNHTK